MQVFYSLRTVDFNHRQGLSILTDGYESPLARPLEDPSQGVGIENEMAVVSWSENAHIQVRLELVLILVLVGDEIGLDFSKCGEKIISWVEIVLGRVRLVGWVALPLQVRLDGVYELDGGFLVQRDRI